MADGDGAADISVEGKLILRCLDDFQKSQTEQWRTQDAAVVRLHERIEKLSAETAASITKLVEANACNITRADCDACKDQRRGVNPWLAFVGVPLMLCVLTAIFDHAEAIYHWMAAIASKGAVH